MRTESDTAVYTAFPLQMWYELYSRRKEMAYVSKDDRYEVQVNQAKAEEADY